MAQPEYVPIDAGDRVRPAERLPAPRRWLANRPGEVVDVELPKGKRFGSPGPDQGYAFKLAHLYDGHLTLTEGEHAEDAVAGCVAVALRRASLFGRAPVVYDLELAFGVWGFLDSAPPDLVEFRKPLFQAVAHHYAEQRNIVDRVPESTLRMAPDGVRSRVADWRSLLVV